LPKKKVNEKQSKYEELDNDYGIKSFKIVHESLKEGILNVNKVLEVFRSVVHE
jgi:hypothetical protein